MALRAQILLIWPVLAKQPINDKFCDILVLLNHLNNVTMN